MRRKFLLRLRSLFHSQVLDQELDDEVRFHVEQQAAEFVRQGIPSEQAEAMARRPGTLVAMEGMRLDVG